MPPRILLTRAVRYTFVFLLGAGLIGTSLPQQAYAQSGPAGADVGEQLLGGLNDSTASGFSPGNFLNGLVEMVTGNTGNTGNGGGSGDVPSGGSSSGGGFNAGGSNIVTQGVDSALDTGANFLGGFLDTLATIGHAFEDNPLVNLIGNVVDGVGNIVDAIITEGVETGINVSNDVFNNTFPGESAGGSTSGGVTQGGQTVTLPNGQNLTLTQGQTATINPNGSVTINLTNGHTAVISSEGYVTEYNAQGEPINSNDPAINPGNWDGSAGNGNGPSIPGASIGTVGNPFSDGTDKDDAKSSNQEDTSNPYLFEYDPNSTNNNPAGGEAQSQ